MKDLTKLYIFLPPIHKTPNKSKRDRATLIRFVRRHKQRVHITRKIEEADIVFCFSHESLQEAKDIRGDLYCFVPHNIDTGTYKGGSKIDFFDLETILELILLGFQMRAKQAAECVS